MPEETKAPSKKTKPRAARKPRVTKAAPAPPINKIPVSVTAPRRLLDEKLVAASKVSQRRLSSIILIALILGVLVGTGLMFYWEMIKKFEIDDDAMPEITVPESADETEPTPPPVPEPAASAPQFIVISDTPTAYLNVRQGPGTGYGLIGRIYPGESYEFVSEDTVHGWYQIKLADGSTGWVSKTYAKLK